MEREINMNDLPDDLAAELNDVRLGRKTLGEEEE